MLILYYTERKLHSEFLYLDTNFRIIQVLYEIHSFRISKKYLQLRASPPQGPRFVQPSNTFQQKKTLERKADITLKVPKFFFYCNI